MPTTSFQMFHVQVTGSNGAIYLVSSIDLIPVACSCPHFVHRAGPRDQMCKHMKARCGRTAVGVTRCWGCEQMLSVEDLDGQPRDRGFDVQRDPRFCVPCGESVDLPIEDYSSWRSVDATVVRGSGVPTPMSDPSDDS